MTRIDMAVPGEREVLKAEIKKEIRQEDLRRRLTGCAVLAVIVLALLAVPAYFVAATLARTGFVHVPVLSAWLYKPSTPVRRVMPLVGSNANTVMVAASAKAKFDAHTNLLALTLTETDLTTIAQEAVRTAKQEDLPFPVRDVQLAIDPDAMELFAVSPQKNRDATVRVRFLPVMRPGGIDVEVQEARIGDLELPRSIAQFAFGSIGRTVLRAVLDETADIGTLFSIEPGRGSVRFLIQTKNP